MASGSGVSSTHGGVAGVEWRGSTSCWSASSALPAPARGRDLNTPFIRVLSIGHRDLSERAMLTEMSWLDIFAEPEPDDLPPDLRRLNRPLVLWYASAGRDFRPLVYTTPSYQARLSARIGEPLQLPEPNLFVYTCLDEKYEPWHEDEVLHEDYGTLVKCRSATPVRLDRQLVPWAKVRGSARFGSDPRPHGEADGHILDVEVLSLRGMGTFRRNILYLRYENNHSWDALFGSGWRVDLKYVCATREGLGMGGCGKSVLQHIYKEGRIVTARRIGVEPQFVITWCDYTDEMFRTAASRYYPHLRRIAPYIPEDEGETEHWVYRLWE